MPVSLRVGVVVELLLTVAAKHQPCVLRFWNYNCSDTITLQNGQQASALNKGMRRIQVSVNGTQAWKGELPRAPGTQTDDYSFDVDIVHRKSIPRLSKFKFEVPNLPNKTDDRTRDFPSQEAAAGATATATAATAAGITEAKQPKSNEALPIWLESSLKKVEKGGIRRSRSLDTASYSQRLHDDSNGGAAVGGAGLRGEGSQQRISSERRSRRRPSRRNSNNILQNGIKGSYVRSHSYNNNQDVRKPLVADVDFGTSACAAAHVAHDSETPRRNRNFGVPAPKPKPKLKPNSKRRPPTRNGANNSVGGMIGMEAKQSASGTCSVTSGNHGITGVRGPTKQQQQPKTHEIRGRSVMLILTENWGDPHFIGLTGLELLDANLNPIQAKLSLTAFPRDMNSIPGHSGDTRTLDKLLDKQNVTVDDTHMWLAPKLRPKPNSCNGDEAPSQFLQLNLPKETVLGGLRVWNYNKSEKDSKRGVRRCSLLIDGKDYSPPGGQVVRKAPGKSGSGFNFGQLIRFKHPDLCELVEREQVRVTGYPIAADFVLPVHPTGHTLRIDLIDTWGDLFYLGLNGLEIFDQNGNRLPVNASHVAAVPESVRVLADCSGDSRTPDKLVDGVNETLDATHMWLAPYDPDCPEPNQVFIHFDSPVMISHIKIWNYAKTPERGAKTVMIYLDESLIFCGTLRKSASASESGNNFSSAQPFGYFGFGAAQTIIFSDDRQLWNAEKKNSVMESAQNVEAPVVLINDGVRIETTAGGAVSNLRSNGSTTK